VRGTAGKVHAMIKSLVLFSISLLFATAPAAPNKGGQHLEPVNAPIYWGVEQAVIDQSVYKEAFGPDVLIRVRQTSAGPGPEDDEMLLMKRTGSSYRIVHLKSPVLLVKYGESFIRQWGAPENAATRMRYPRDYRKLKVSRCEIQIPPSVAEGVLAAWRGVLLQTRYDEEPWRGMDGAWAEFAMRDKMQELEGRIWSPDDNSQPGMLWHLADLMSDHCKARTARSIKKVSEQAVALLKRLKSEQQP
jgi:hypothetical protein